MIYSLGKNSHFFRATPDSVARLKAKIQPYYDFPKSAIEKLPSLSSEAFVVPRFLYEVEYYNKTYPPSPIYLPDFESPKSETGTENPFEFVRGGKFQKKTTFFRSKRNLMIPERYLSLRDIVNPSFSDSEILAEIDKTYFDKNTKAHLYRLVKILYSASPNEEWNIISSLFSHEKDFAKYLCKQMFTAEILPLVHGNFLQTLLTSLDERFIKFHLPKLSPPVRSVLERSVSKNKWKLILESPPKEREDKVSLLDLIEEKIYSEFSRKIYYEEGNYFVYHLEGENNPNRIPEEISFQDSSQFLFSRTNSSADFLGVSNTKQYFAITNFQEVFRVDVWINKREREEFLFFKIPPKTILEIPYFSVGRATILSGIDSTRACFEGILQWSSF